MQLMLYNQYLYTLHIENIYCTEQGHQEQLMHYTKIANLKKNHLHVFL